MPTNNLVMDIRICLEIRCLPFLFLVRTITCALGYSVYFDGDYGLELMIDFCVVFFVLGRRVKSRMKFSFAAGLIYSEYVSMMMNERSATCGYGDKVYDSIMLPVHNYLN